MPQRSRGRRRRGRRRWGLDGNRTPQWSCLPVPVDVVPVEADRDARWRLRLWRQLVADRVRTLGHDRRRWPVRETDDVADVFDTPRGERFGELPQDPRGRAGVVEDHGADRYGGSAGENELERVETGADATHPDDRYVGHGLVHL